jgi:hypothetical protein
VDLRVEIDTAAVLVLAVIDGVFESGDGALKLSQRREQRRLVLQSPLPAVVPHPSSTGP